ncbi:hypothetical protein QVD17_05532 [Tagetes erecta]|uniref:Endoplasmic reticulum oxidoreductin-1 n=1 Tax=Tagetes erecta TaxID=13708 RepID=A0AAD8PBK7_TARER|nr:hypothetical protein QVD17_05532 [Tagetes erecta]
MLKVDRKSNNVDHKKKKNNNNNSKWKRWRLITSLIVVFVAMYFNPWRHSLIYSLLNKTYICSEDNCEYTGIVEECCCDYETINDINEGVLHPLLQELVKTPFFRYFKVKLWCDCPFWPDDGMCRLRDCSVCECSENEFPESFKTTSLNVLPKDDPVCQEGKPEAVVDRTIDVKSFRGWVEVDNPWTNDDETDNGEMTYVNLQLNAERHTGYTGPSARRIWDAIYSENCPRYAYGETCTEKKVLYKLISGLHSSISSHIAAEYLYDEATNKWASNLRLMHNRVLKHFDRVENLYFTFLFVLRAVTKATSYLDQAEYDSGNHVEDLRAQFLIRELVHDSRLEEACALPFDEAELWQGQGGPILRQQIQNQFRNISALMDCVGCEKCRLWGKLQVLGLGTSLQILFSVDDQGNPDPDLQLQRNEVIALLNLLNRLSESLIYVTKMRDEVAKDIGLIHIPWGPLITHWYSFNATTSPFLALTKAKIAFELLFSGGRSYQI